MEEGVQTPVNFLANSGISSAVIALLYSHPCTAKGIFLGSLFNCAYVSTRQILAIKKGLLPLLLS